MEIKAYSTSWLPLSFTMIITLFLSNFFCVWYATENDLRMLSKYSSNSYQHLKQVTFDEEPNNFIEQIFLDANITLFEPLDKIPTWKGVTAQYGPHPIIHNLKSCHEFRSSVPISRRMMGVAGLFNTGTHYLAALLENNCRIPNRSSNDPGYPFREQVPWGKHNTPMAHRLLHSAGRHDGSKWTLNHKFVMPVVIIKDPFHWMVSNCRHEYFLWEHDEKHCPNVTMSSSNKIVPNSFTISFPRETKEYTSLVHFWNSWYEEYELQATSYPLIFVRFEDLVFHTKYIISSLCDCIGGTQSTDSSTFHYLESSAKNYSERHAGANGFIEAIMQYGNPQNRLNGWTHADFQYAIAHLDQRLMMRYGYRLPNWN